MRLRNYSKITCMLSLASALVLTSLPTPLAVKSYASAAVGISAATEAEKLDHMFTTIDLMDATVSELKEEMEQGNLTSKQLVQMYIDRIQKYDQSLDLNSIIMVNPNALSEAEKLDAERRDGKIKGRLHGIPVIVKDNYDVEGLATSAGCLSLQNSIANDDAYAVKKLRDEGAIILAKANMSEFASSGSNSRSTLGGTVHNAYDTRRTAAGSSGGTAVAITANFAAAGFGTDTGSSIRRPSSLSNLYGIRPSKGLTSIDGVVPLLGDRDVTGPMCRTAEDMALMLDVISGTDASDHYTVDANANQLKGNGYVSSLGKNGLKGKRIGFLSNSFGYNVGKDDVPLDKESKVSLDAKVSGMVTRARGNLKKAGAEIVDISKLIPESLYTSLRNCGYSSTGEYDLNVYFSQLGDGAPFKTVKNLLETGYGVGYSNLYPSGETAASSLAEMVNPYDTDAHKEMWSKMLNFRDQISKILRDNQIDAVMYVSQNDVADIEETSDNKNNGASYINNFGPVAGLPDMMIPMGMSKTDAANGYTHAMPLGMSMFSSYGNEKALMEIAYAYEQQAGDSLREMPDTVPALKDEKVAEYLEELEEKVYDIDYSLYSVYPEGKVKSMYRKCEKAEEVDVSDVYATYQAAMNLAKAYDKVMEVLNGNKKVAVSTQQKDPSDSTQKQSPTQKPGKTSITHLTTKKGRKIKVMVKKLENVSGYQVKYSTSKKFAAKSTKTVSGKAGAYTVKKLKKKKYYFKAMAYVKQDGKTVYGTWSKTKSVRIK